MITPDLAQRIAQDFIDGGILLGGCTVERLLGFGASGVVLLGRDGPDRVAIKVYGKHLINEATPEQAAAELERIKRQVDLKSQSHPNIVRTRRSGQCNETQYHYLIMDFVDDKTLDEVLSDIPREKIRSIIHDIAKATLFLQGQLGHVHRDLKPPNIALNLETYKVTLLDLGLIRPVTGTTATDQAPRFLGTKRFAPPEFLHGTMSKDEPGWDAVSFYQLGALLYCLIMRGIIFDGLDGDALITAIDTQVPQIDAVDVPADLILLARDCLQKDADTRRSLVTWERFFSVPDPNAATSENDRLRDAVRRLPPRPKSQQYPQGAKEQHAIDIAYKRVSLAVDYHVRSLLNGDESLYPRHRVTLEAVSTRSFRVIATMTYERLPTDVDVTICISCDLLDVASLLCQCELTGCVGDIDSGQPIIQRSTPFKGSFVEGAFSAALDEHFPAAVAAILNSYDQGGTPAV